MLKIDPSRQAKRFLKRVHPRHGEQLARKITELRENPNPPGSKQLKGKAAAYQRAEIGAYRIVYRVEGDTLRVLLIGIRADSDVYRRLSRKIGR